jgi:glycosyltransferase involved in cell wall biosynthesis
MSPFPVLSVVIANYNHAQYLPIALDAIVSQSHQADEIIVVDDASTDASLSLLENYAKKHPRIQVHKNPSNQGPSATLARGVSLSYGDYIAFCGADDRVLPSFFETGLSFLKRYPQAGLFCAKTCYFYDNHLDELKEEIDWLRLSESKFVTPDEAPSFFRTTNFRISSPATIYKRTSILKAGGYQDRAKMLSDWLLNCQIALQEGFVYVPQNLAAQRLYTQSLTYYSSIRKNRFLKEQAYTYVFSALFDNKSSKAYKKALILYHLGPDILVYLLKHFKYWLMIPPLLWKKCRMTLKKIC